MRFATDFRRKSAAMFLHVKLLAAYRKALIGPSNRAHLVGGDLPFYPTFSVKKTHSKKATSNRYSLVADQW